MNKLTTLFGLTASLVMAAGAASQTDRRGGAHEPKQDKAHSMSHQSGKELATIDKLIGAEVLLKASQEERREARRENEKADRPEAEIADIIVDLQDGSLDWAVISVGGFLGMDDKTIAVPCSALKPVHKGDEARFELDATEKVLKDLAKFDLDGMEQTGVDRAVTVVEASWVAVGRATDAGFKTGEKKDKGKSDEQRGEPVVVGETIAVAVPMRRALASKFDEYPVRAKDDEFGSIGQVIIDTNQKQAAWFIVSTGGVLGVGDTEYLVPYPACHLIKHEDGYAWKLMKSKEQMKNAVRYEEPEKGLLDPQSMKKAADFFGIEHSGHRADKSKSGAHDK